MSRNETQPDNAKTGPKSVDWGPAFLAAFEISGHCDRASAAAGVTYPSVWRRRQGDPEFAAAYLIAQATAAHGLEAEAVRRAYEGVRRMKFNAKTGLPYIDPETGLPYIEHEYSDRLLELLLRRHFVQYREKSEVSMNHSGSVTVVSEEKRRSVQDRVKLFAGDC